MYHTAYDMGYTGSRMKKHSHGEGGFTIVELAVGMLVFGVVALSFLGLFTSLVHSAILAKEKAVASTLATNQMEYLKSLPYDNLAVSGGAIYATNPLPATVTKKLDGIKYTVKNSVNYVDDAYDGCGSYANQTLKDLYCRNQPAPAGAPATDLNPQDYKIVNVKVTGPSNNKLAEVDTHIAAKVSETASTTGALFIKVVDSAGNPISGATVQVQNTTITPNANLTDSSDSNGVAIFYGLPPDSGNDYRITVSKTGWSTLSTIQPSGTLQPTYLSQKILTQQSSFATLTIKPQGDYSLIVETTNTSGAALANAKVYIKGGYKKYTLTTNTAYYFDNLSPTDVRPTTDASGLAAITGLVPGPYIFCGDAGATSCAVGATTYYLAAAVPYGGSSLSPVNVPTYDPASPPATMFALNGNSYLQKVRLMLTTSSTFPRITSLTPSQISLGTDPLSNFAFTLSGANLPCASTAASCGTTVTVTQGTTNYAASCTGNSSPASQLSCTANLTGLVAGETHLTIVSGGNTLALPGSPMIGGFVVAP
jgi:type II secretory pathway pseudopilin PulG